MNESFPTNMASSMKWAVALSFAMLSPLLISLSDGAEGIICLPTQFIELGQRAIVKCSSKRMNYGVYWYNSTNVANNPIISLENTEKAGQGLESGEYDIFHNGSLIIQNVTLQHDRVFSVIFLSNRHSEGAFFNISLVVTVHPPQNYPYIPQCNHEDNCFTSLADTSVLDCSVTDARPAVNLTWVQRTAKGEVHVPCHTSVHYNGRTYHTQARVTLKQSQFPTSFAVLVCKSHSSPPLMTQSESGVLLDINDHNISLNKPVQMYVSKGTTVSLPTVYAKSLYLVWKKRSTMHEYSSLIATFRGKVLKLEDYETDARRSLLIPVVHLYHEGIYVCFYGDGVTEGLLLYNVSVFGKGFL